MWLSDEEYVYQQDIKEKKSAGRGAFHKKGGSKSKKCTLPSDYMTKKEKEAMNGEVFSYNPNNWYTWEEFKKMPMEYQVKYMNSLLNRYNCSFSAIAKYVFKISDMALRTHFTRRDQLQYINMPSARSGKSLLAGNDRLKCDYESAINTHEDHSEEIQNGSEEPKELTIQEKIKRAQDTVDLYASRGMQITPKLINQIYEEMTGMSFALAMNYFEEHKAEGPIAVVKSVEETDSGLRVTAELTESGKKFIDEHPEDNDKPVDDSTDVKSFSIIMDHIDMDIIQYVSNLFEGKKIVVSFEVKEAL